MVVGNALWAQTSIPDELDLNTALQFALQHNFAIQQAQERIAKQQDFLVQVRSVVLPQVALDYNYTLVDRDRLEDFGGTSFGSDQAWSVNLELTQRIYAGSRGLTRLGEEKLRLKAAELEMQAIIQGEMLRVRSHFYDLLLAREQIKVQQQSLSLLEEQLSTIQDRYDAGAVPRFDLIRAQVALANGRPPLIRAKNRYRIAWEELREVLGAPSDPTDDLNQVPLIAGDLQYQPEPYLLLDALAQARINRPEIQGYVLLIEAAEKAVKAEKGLYAPDLELVLGYQVSKSNFSSQIDATIDGWAVGLQGNWSIFDSGAIRAQVAQAKSDLRQVKLSEREVMLQIDVEVRRAYSRWLEAEELVKASEFVVEQAEESLRLATERYAVGSATHLDVLAAQVDLTQARTNQVEAVHGHKVAVAALRRAMGISVYFQ